MTTKDTCDCSTNGSPCQLEDDGANRVIKSTSFQGVELNGPDTGHAFEFKTQRGTVDGAETVKLESATGSKVNVVVGPVGRIKICSPSGTGNMGGYPVCS